MLCALSRRLMNLFRAYPAAAPVAGVEAERPAICQTCDRFLPRPASMPWPMAGVSPGADGQCGRKRVDTKVREWRHASDWCTEYAPRKEVA